MISFVQWAQRNWRSFRPVELPKQSDALRMGLLGASKIAPISTIIPAKSHPEVIIAGVAARDPKRAQTYAQSHGIPNFYSSYQALLDDPCIDAVYVALPNGLHYEWAMKALQAGKHVLLEKPSTSNASEARSLFRSPLLAKDEEVSPRARTSLVLLDAVHIRFHPAWQKFLSFIDSSEISQATSTFHIPKSAISSDDIRFQYQLSGGCLMDLGSYSVQMLRQVFRTEPVECLTASVRRMPAGLDQDIDQAFSASWAFPNGGTGSIVSDLAAAGGHWFPWLTDGLPAVKVPMCSVKHREKTSRHPTLQGKEVVTTKTVIIWSIIFASIWHRIDVIEDHVLRNVKDGRIERQWTEKSYYKQYNGGCGDDSWSTYRHQLEQFVNRIRGRRGSGIWIDGEDSIRQIEMMDRAYEKAGMHLRPTSHYIA